MGNQGYIEGQAKEVTRPIEVITEEIQFYKHQAAASLIEIGKRLLEAKQCLPHGAWGDWLTQKVDFSERTAQNFMRIAREYSNPQTLALLGNSASKALSLLTLPMEEREAFAEAEHEVDGEKKTVAEMSNRELECIVKELEAERKAKEDLQTKIDLLTVENESTLKESGNYLEDKEKADEARAEAEERLEALKTELGELRATAPKEREVSADVMEQLKKEVEADALKKQEEKLQKKIDKAKKDAEKAEQEAKEAKDALQAKETEVQTAKRLAEKQQLENQKQVDALRKQLAVASNTKIVAFKVHFEAAQKEMNEMAQCIEDLKANDETDEAGKLTRAILSLCEATVAGLGE